MMIRIAMVLVAAMTLAIGAYGQDAVTAHDDAAAPNAADTAAASADTTAPLLKIATDPPGAAITVDGEPYGVTPVEIAGLAPGQYSVELSLAGHFRRRVTIQLDSSVVDLNFELSRPAAITITSEPTGAAITIDNNAEGLSPIQKERLRPGEYHLSASMDGYNQLDTTITLSSGAADTTHLVLTPIPPPQEPPPAPAEVLITEEPTKTTGKKSWRNEIILIAFFIFIAAMIGVEKASY